MRSILSAHLENRLISTKVIEKKGCGLCGHPNAVSNRFCISCGAKFYDATQDHAKLHLLVGEPKGAVFTLSKKRKNTIGRDGSNTIILGDEQISNKHAVIRFEENAFYLDDLGSKNGVLLDGRKITEAVRLEDGNVIRLGNSVLMIETPMYLKVNGT